MVVIENKIINLSMKISESELTKMQVLLESKNPELVDLLQMVLGHKIEFLVSEFGMSGSANIRKVVKDAFANAQKYDFISMVDRPGAYTKLTFDCVTVMDHHMICELLRIIIDRSFADRRVGIISQQTEDQEYQSLKERFVGFCLDYVMGDKFTSLDTLQCNLKELSLFPLPEKHCQY
jgi:hypothetical protein